MKHLSLIQAIVLLEDDKNLRRNPKYKNHNTYQFEVTKDKIDLAQKLVREVLVGRMYKLSAQSKFLLLLIDQMVEKMCEIQRVKRADYYFSYRDIKNYTGWNSLLLRSHLKQLKQRGHIKAEWKNSRPVLKLLFVDRVKRIKHFYVGSDEHSI